MSSQYALVRSVASVLPGLLLALVAGCTKPVDQSGPSAAAAVSTNSTTASPGKAASRLGDLTGFHSIATDVASMVDKGDLLTAKARIKDLELAWDSAEAGLKPRAADDWHVLDKSIDKALTALRADKASLSDCKAAMANLLKTFDTLQGKV